MGLGEEGGVLSKTSHNGTIGGMDSERITTVPRDFLQEAVDSIPGRLRKLVDAAGVCIEF